MDRAVISAKVRMPSGATVEISGSKDDVRDLLSIFATSRTAPPGRAQVKGRRNSEGRNRRPRANVSSVVADLVASGFFDGHERALSEVASKLDERGITLKGRALGALARSLTLACRDSQLALQRRKVTGQERKGGERWVFSRKS